MPRGKELEQLPISNTLTGMGEDRSRLNREVLTGITEEERPKPAKAAEEGKQK